MTMTFSNLKVPIGWEGHAKDGSVPNLGTDKSARTVHIEKNNSKCISNLYIAMTHLRINKFAEPPVCITLLVSPPLICAESVRFDVVSTENVRITSVTVYGKKRDNCPSHVKA